jgi:FAD-dependent urate hydroxylase
MKALIVGAGIGGPVAAMAVQRAGIDATVYEAHVPIGDEVGSYLTVATNGLDALQAIDAAQAILDVGFPTRVNTLFSGTGKRLGTIPLGCPRPGGIASQTVKRARLQRVLQRLAARRGVPFEYGKRLVSAAVTARGVVAQFEDGSEAEGDLLIGCDGIHSVTRRTIDTAAPSPRYVGLLNFGGYTRGRAPSEPGAWNMIFGRRAFFGYTADPAGGTVWFANVPRASSTPAERRTTTNEQWKQYLVELFADDRGPATALIAAGDLELAADNTYDLATIPTWFRGPMIVIGDAAHAPSPTSGQGASMAIEDGVVLAKCLRDEPDVSRAFAAYERVRRARVERIVAQGARGSSQKTPGAVGRIVRDMLLPLLFRLVVTEKSFAWMYDYHVDWQAPIVTE